MAVKIEEKTHEEAKKIARNAEAPTISLLCIKATESIGVEEEVKCSLCSSIDQFGACSWRPPNQSVVARRWREDEDRTTD